MQKDMKEKMAAAEKKVSSQETNVYIIIIHKLLLQAAEKAKEQAELERIRDQANFQKELEKRMDIESELRSKVSHTSYKCTK